MSLEKARSHRSGCSRKGLLPSWMLTQESIICSLQVSGHIPVLPLHVCPSVCLTARPPFVHATSMSATTGGGQGLKTPSGQSLLPHQAQNEAAPLSPGIQGSLLVLQPGSQTPVSPSACPHGSDGPRWRPGHCPPLSSLPTTPLGVWYRVGGGMRLLLPAGHGRVGGLSILPWLGPLDFSVPD